MEKMDKVKHTGIMNKMRDKMPVIIIILIIAFLATIVFEWGMNYMGIGGQQEPFAKINNQEITYQEFEKIVQQQLDQMRQQNEGRDVTEEQIKQTRDQVWNSLVSQTITKQAIQKYGITVSDQEILEWIGRPETLPEPIKKNFMDSTGVFNIGFYQQALNMKTKEATTFWKQVEEYLRETLLAEKLQSILTEGVVVSEGDVLDKYKDDNIRANFNYAFLDLNSIKDSNLYAVTNEDMKKYYDENKIDFKQNESFKLKYINFPNTATQEDSTNVFKQMNSYLKQLKLFEPGDTAIKEYVNENSTVPYSNEYQKTSAFDAAAQKFLFNAKPGDISDALIGNNGYQVIRLIDTKEGTEELSSASHILVKVDTDTAAALKKATDYYNRVKNGEDIEKLAFEVSDDPSAKQNNGNLGWFAKGSMVKEFEDAVNNNPEGTVVGPVKTNFGFHIIKVLGKSKKEFKVAQVTQTVKPSSRSLQLTKKKAEEFYQDVTKGGKNIDTLAAQMKMTVQTSPDIQKDGMVPLAGKDKNLMDMFFKDNVNKVSEPVKVNDGFAIYTSIQKTAEGFQNFDSVKTNMIKPKVINEKKYKILLGIANDLEGKISNGDILALKNTAPQYVYETADSFSVSKPNTLIGQDYALSNAIFKMKPGEVSKPIKGAKGYYIVKLNSVTDFIEADYLVKAEEIKKTLTGSKKQQVISEWLQNAQADADIIDNRSKYLN